MSARFTCRSCGGQTTTTFLDLGMMPPSDALRREDQLGLPEKKYPLKVAFCHDCTLVQITETVPPEELFSKDYVYYSSFSNALLEHARKNVEARIASRKLSARKLSGQSLVVELASNDGYLLQFYKQAGVPVLGIDPAEGQARTANERGIHTLCDFFTVDLARRLRDEGKQADVVHGNNVLAHVADTNGFVSGIATILKPDGVAVLEFPYLRDLVEHCEFDTIYHEHLCYFSVHALVTLFERHGLYLNDVEHHPIHGGSLRVFVGKNRDVQPAVSQFLERERREGMNLLEHYAGFAGRVESVKARLRQIVDDLKAEGKSLAAYGAAAKGTILVNYVGLGRDKIDFVVDRNVHKQGRYMPGVHIPIRPVETLTERMPAYTIVLPWNFKDEILAQQTEYRGKGGKFIIPIPWPEIV